jgi:CelD/BcsL family acetyltransferase involved in cellulose biosynthesis
LDWLVAPPAAAVLLRAVRAFLSSAGIHALHLSDVPSGSSLLQLLRSSSRRGELEMEIEPCAVCPVAPLPRSWATYLGLRSRNTREAVRRARRRGERVGGVELRLHRSGSELPSFLSVFLDLHLRWWAARQRPSVLSAPGAADFLGLALRRLLASERADLSVQHRRRDGAPISAFITLKNQTIWYYYLAGVDPDFADLSPGVSHMASLARRAIEEGAGELDLLRGEEPYKGRWADAARRTWRCRVRAG